MTRRARPARPTAAAVRGVALATALTAAAATPAVARALCRASSRERRRPMPGDAIVPDPMLAATQAITIDAPPRRVWPWLAQLGAGRAGWYSYDRIDNGGRPSAETILPECQHVAPGDVLPATPGATDAFVVAVAEAPRDLVLTVPTVAGPVMTWEFLLEPLDGARTRLVVRVRVSARWRELASRAPAGGAAGTTLVERVYRGLGRLPVPLLTAAAGFGHRVMESRQLRGIKRRAEADGRPHAS